MSTLLWCKRNWLSSNCAVEAWCSSSCYFFCVVKKSPSQKDWDWTAWKRECKLRWWLLHRYDSEEDGVDIDVFEKNTFSLHRKATARSAVTAITEEWVGKQVCTFDQSHRLISSMLVHRQNPLRRPICWSFLIYLRRPLKLCSRRYNFLSAALMRLLLPSNLGRQSSAA